MNEALSEVNIGLETTHYLHVCAWSSLTIWKYICAQMYIYQWQWYSFNVPGITIIYIDVQQCGSS